MMLRAGKMTWIALAALLPLGGCRVTKHQHGNGSDVDIGTPFGSVQVKTDPGSLIAPTGLTQYPGSVLVPKKRGDSAGADVNLSFGRLKLAVHAAELETADAQDKVLAFYKQDLGRYGDVLTCRNGATVGLPSRTSEGLTCDSDQRGGTRNGGEEGETQLLAGSERRRHIVSVEPHGSGSRIGLVSLELPRSLKGGSSEERE